MTRIATRHDLDAIVQVHRAAFPDFTLTRLGPAFLRAYYQCLLDYPRGIMLVATDSQGEVVGFAAGFAEPAGFYASLRARRPRLAWALLPGLLRRPWLASRVLANGRRVDVWAAHPSSPTNVELSSLGVAPTGSGKGIGRQLIDAFRAATVQNGGNLIRLTTDAKDNDRINDFYVRVGFRLVDQIHAPGQRLMNAYEWAPTPTSLPEKS